MKKAVDAIRDTIKNSSELDLLKEEKAKEDYMFRFMDKKENVVINTFLSFLKDKIFLSVLLPVELADFDESKKLYEVVNDVNTNARNLKCFVTSEEQHRIIFSVETRHNKNINMNEFKNEFLYSITSVNSAMSVFRSAVSGEW